MHKYYVTIYKLYYITNALASFLLAIYRYRRAVCELNQRVLPKHRVLPPGESR